MDKLHEPVRPESRAVWFQSEGVKTSEKRKVSHLNEMHVVVVDNKVKQVDLNVTHGSTWCVLDGDRELPRVSTFSEDVLTCRREGVEAPIKGLKVHVASHRALACREK